MKIGAVMNIIVIQSVLRLLINVGILYKYSYEAVNLKM